VGADTFGTVIGGRTDVRRSGLSGTWNAPVVSRRETRTARGRVRLSSARIVALICFLTAGGMLRVDAQAGQKGPDPGHNAANTYGDNSVITADDPAERSAYAAIAAMIDDSSQRHRRELAERFLAEYPRSWRLSAVYEIATKASIALGDLRAALDFGSRSLRLLPENPFVLLPIADVQIKTGSYEAARRSAQDAIWCLDRFDRPAAIDARAWPQLKNRLQAESYFDMGRAAAAEGLDAKGEDRVRRLAEAATASLRALSFDPGEVGAVLLLGMVYLAEARPSDAAGAFAFASRADGPLRAQAQDRLRAIYSDKAVSGGRLFNEWVASLAMPKPPEAAALAEPRKFSAYVGSESCQACHRA
jgi:tetratricopeptide (TPR) repeat protein